MLNTFTPSYRSIQSDESLKVGMRRALRLSAVKQSRLDKKSFILHSQQNYYYQKMITYKKKFRYLSVSLARSKFLFTRFILKFILFFNVFFSFQRPDYFIHNLSQSLYSMLSMVNNSNTQFHNKKSVPLFKHILSKNKFNLAFSSRKSTIWTKL